AVNILGSLFYGAILGTSAVLQALGGLLFAVVIWPRVRAARIPPSLGEGTRAVTHGESDAG
ncbi:MAG: hypothetical protein AAB092_02355, partial [Chloroflexota bacterium]